MEKANVKEAINGSNNDKYITPYTLKKVVDEVSDEGTPTTVTVKVNSTTTLPTGSSASVSNSGDDVNVKLNFGIPTGATGANGTNGTNGTDGEAATVAVHSTVTLEPDQPAAVTNMGTSNAANLKFEIPKGPKGDTGGDITVLDSLPIGSIVDYDGIDVPNGFELVTTKQYAEKVLYNDATGTNGTVTLSETSANFDYLEIYGYSLFGENIYTKYYVNSGKDIGLYYLGNSGGNQLRINSQHYTLSGSTITVQGAYHIVVFGTLINEQNTNKEIYITRVIGFKEV